MKTKFMRAIITALVFIFTFNSYSQTDTEKVKSVLMDYIEGTANGQISRIKRAFNKDANLYSIVDDSLRALPSKKYIGFFKEGKKNGRLGHIESIDIKNDAAVGIVKIDMPGRKRRYTDYMLLLKTDGEWKIIHKSYTWEPYERKGKVLFVVSNVSSYGSNNKRTGTHYEELVQPYDALQKAGYEVDFVSPKGGEIPVAYINLQDKLQLHYFYDSALQYKLKNTLKPSQVDSKLYQAVYYCGGSAAVFDVPNSKGIQKITQQIYEDHNGVVSSICHGAAGLVNVKLNSGAFLVNGKRVNSFTNEEEGNGEHLPFLIETKLKERGAVFKSSGKWESHVEVDGNLITGQNPNSLEVFSKALINRLNTIH